MFSPTEWLAGGVVFLLAVAFPHPQLAAVLALGVAAVMVSAAVVSSLRGASGNCAEIIADVLGRESGEDGER